HRPDPRDSPSISAIPDSRGSPSISAEQEYRGSPLSSAAPDHHGASFFSGDQTTVSPSRALLFSSRQNSVWSPSVSVVGVTVTAPKHRTSSMNNWSG
ncbi:hypothetical protein HN873_064128, partial [Arachis hypogaea]